MKLTGEQAALVLEAAARSCEGCNGSGWVRRHRKRLAKVHWPAREYFARVVICPDCKNAWRMAAELNGGEYPPKPRIVSLKVNRRDRVAPIRQALAKRTS